MIRNKAVVNEDTSGNVLQMQAEIKRLKVTIERLKTQCTKKSSYRDLYNRAPPIKSPLYKGPKIQLLCKLISEMRTTL